MGAFGTIWLNLHLRLSDVPLASPITSLCSVTDCASVAGCALYKLR